MGIHFPLGAVFSLDFYFKENTVIKFNTEALQDDLRKLGVILVSGGLASLVLDTPTAATQDAFIAIAIGVAVYLVGFISKNNKEGS